MLVDLAQAQLADTGGKAAALGRLLRAGIDVPPGVVVPTGQYRRHLAAWGLDPAVLSPAQLHREILRGRLEEDLVRALEVALDLGPLAVRSSASSEDGRRASAAGQHESVLAVEGVDAVGAAILCCWASLWSPRAIAYREGPSAPGPAPEMAVLVQRYVEAEISGVLFTGQERILEAVPGPGTRLVGGEITPDAWRIDASGIQERRPGVYSPGRELCLEDSRVLELDALGRQISGVLGAPADIEWALAGGRIHVLQARPITAEVPDATAPGDAEPGVLHGTAASGGVATGTVRRVRGPQDFRAVQPGDVLLCQATDPAWTPLFQIAGAVVTRTGGALSHAAIVAREVGIPAVLAVPGAWEELVEGEAATVDGNAGTVRAAPSS